MHTKSGDLDLKAIREAVEDYYGGWYEANPERMEHCLHAELAKRAVRKDTSGNEFLHQLSKEQMLEKTEEGGGSDTPADKRLCDITILDHYEEIATVKVIATDYIDYLHLVRQAGRWRIVNALWTDNRARQ